MPNSRLEMGAIPNPRELGFTEDEPCSQLSHKIPGYGGEKEALRVLNRLRSDLSVTGKLTKSSGISKLLPWLVREANSLFMNKACLSVFTSSLRVVPI